MNDFDVVIDKILMMKSATAKIRTQQIKVLEPMESYLNARKALDNVHCSTEKSYQQLPETTFRNKNP